MEISWQLPLCVSADWQKLFYTASRLRAETGHCYTSAWLKCWRARSQLLGRSRLDGIRCISLLEIHSISLTGAACTLSAGKIQTSHVHCLLSVAWACCRGSWTLTITRPTPSTKPSKKRGDILIRYCAVGDPVSVAVGQSNSWGCSAGWIVRGLQSRRFILSEVPDRIVHSSSLFQRLLGV